MKKMFASMSIKARVVIFSLLGLLGFCGILIGNLSFFQTSNEKLASLQNVDLRLVQLANQLQIGLSDLNRQFEAAVAELDKDPLTEAMKTAQQQRQQIASIATINPALQVQADQLGKAFDDYVKENQSYVEGVLAGRYKGDVMFTAFSSALAKREAYDKLLRATGKSINAEFVQTLQSLRNSSTEISKQQFTYAALLFLLVALVVVWFIRTFSLAIENVVGVAGQIADGNLNVAVDTGGSEEYQRLFGALDRMRDRLKEQHEESQSRQKRQNQIAQLNETLRGEKDVQKLGDDVLQCMADLVGNLVGAFYLLENDELVMKASYAYSRRKGERTRFGLGESLVGQAALEQKQFVVRDLPPGYSPVVSGLGEAVPSEVLLVPLVLNGHLLGVLELMSFRSFSDEDLEFLERGSEGMAIALNSAISRVQLALALDQTRQQAEAMEQQQEELRATNEELEEQTAILRSSEENLQQQQEELRVMNEELEERNRLLDRQKEEIIKSNAELEVSRQELQEKAKQLEMSGRYKSEFLSTMSHELRTPLNSILILSQGLMENKRQNLEPKQVEHARVINSSGRDLLLLINDILDLSKVEEGKLELVPEPIELIDLTQKLQAQFEAQAEVKGIDYIIHVDPGLPAAIQADEQRLSQILRNFLSNAFKFTEKGSVELTIEPLNRPLVLDDHTLQPEDGIVFQVKDSGIGIPRDKQQLIFEAFQQVDGTISRKYGGTGLGLTISRKLAQLMGGTIQVDSPGENLGSIFRLIVPRVAVDEEMEVTPEMMRSAAPVQNPVVEQPVLPAKGPAIVIGNKAGNEVLIVEDDVEFSRILQNLAEEFGFKAVCVHTVADANRYLDENLPGSIILDLGLPDAPGQHLLSHLKSDPRTHSIPVHVISGNLNVRPAELSGASEFIAKPFGRARLDQLFSDIGKEISGVIHRSVLVIEDDPVQREQLQTSFTNQEIDCDMAATGEEALAFLQKEQYGAVILDLDLPDCNGFELLEKIGKYKDGNMHVIIYTARDISKKQDAELRRYADRIVLKTDSSITRLLNETTLFLHWLKSDKKRDDTAVPESSIDLNLNGSKNILLVDDDIRNLYSLSSVLEDAGMEIATASTGVEALEVLDSGEKFDLILMDIMMRVWR